MQRNFPAFRTTVWLNFSERYPKEHEPAADHRRQQVIALNAQIDFLPGCPHPVGQAFAVKINVGFAVGARHKVQKFCTVCAYFIIKPAHIQAGNLVQSGEIIPVGAFYARLGYVILQQFVFQCLEEWAFVVAQVRLDPVFRVEEYFAGRFPDAVVFHPLPLLPVIAVGDIAQQNLWLFQVHAAALHKELHGAVCLHYARCHLAGAHFGIDKKIGIKSIRISPGGFLPNNIAFDNALFQRRVGEQISHQRIALAFAYLIVDGGQSLIPTQRLSGVLSFCFSR